MIQNYTKERLIPRFYLFSLQIFTSDSVVVGDCANSEFLLIENFKMSPTCLHFIRIENSNKLKRAFENVDHALV